MWIIIVGWDYRNGEYDDNNDDDNNDDDEDDDNEGRRWSCNKLPLVSQHSQLARASIPKGAEKDSYFLVSSSSSSSSSSKPPYCHHMKLNRNNSSDLYHLFSTVLFHGGRPQSSGDNWQLMVSRMMFKKEGVVISARHFHFLDVSQKIESSYEYECTRNLLLLLFLLLSSP